MRIGIIVGILLGLLWSTPPARSQTVLPTLKLGVGTLAPPSAVFAGATSPAPPSTRDPLVREMARSLHYNIDTIYAYIRNNVELTPSYGLQKGARGVILDGYGTPFDQAQAFVDMLRESDAVAGTGYNAQYVLGEITLTSAQFSSWFGVTDAGSAAAVLADGGIPASVTGSGTSFSVTMSHIWVSATIGGSTYVFDPSYKRHSVIAPGLTMATAMSGSGVTYSASDLLTQGVATATVNTSSEIAGFNTAAFQGRLTAYRANMESYLLNPSNNLVGARTDNVVGHRSITAMPAGPLRQSSLSYQASGTVGTNWTGQIPNAYRTSFAVQFGSSSPTTYYADQVYGIPMLFDYTVYSTGQATGALASPVASNGSITPTTHIGTYQASSTYTCELYPGNTTVSGATLSISIYHPYPNSSGTAGYMNRTISRPLSLTPGCSGRVIITNDWGDLGSRAASMMRRGLSLLNYVYIHEYTCDIPDCGSSQTQFAPDYPTGPQLEAVAEHFSQFLRLAGQEAGGQYQLHDLIGIHTLDNVGTELSESDNVGSLTTDTYQSLMLTMDFEAGVSANPIAGINSQLKAGLVRLAHGGLAAAESGESRRESDSPRDMTSLSLMVQNGGSSGQPYFLLTSANFSNLSNYPAAATNIMAQYISSGYRIFAPASGLLAQTPGYAPAGSFTDYSTLMDSILGYPGGRVVAYRPTFFAFNPSTGDGAFLIYDPRRQWVLKGGTDVTQYDPSYGEFVRPPDNPKPSSKDLVFSEISVNGRTGDFSYAPPADIKDGIGDFPHSLSIQRRYDPTDFDDNGFGVGWKHNWRQSITINNDGDAALGTSGAYGAVSAMVAIQATIDQVSANLSASGADDPQHLLAEAALQEWFVSSTINNSVTVADGFDGDQTFLRAADGLSLASAQPNGARLVQTGIPSDSVINKRLYYLLSFTYTGSRGDTKTYSYLPTSIVGNLLYNPFALGFLTQHSFWLNNWKFPDGTVVTPTYGWEEGGAGLSADRISLNSVVNNLGFGVYGGGPAGSSWTPNTCQNLTNSGLSATAVKVGYQTSYEHATGASTGVFYYIRPDYLQITVNGKKGLGGSGYYDQYYQWPLSLAFTDHAGQTWNYCYSPVTSTYDDSPYGADYAGQLVRLSAVYKPSAPAPANAALTIAMGLDGHVWTVADALGNSHAYYTSPYFYQEVDPLGSTTQTTFDEYGRKIIAVDPLLHTTTYQYDIRDRLIQTTNPLGDYVTNDAYDARSNLLQTTRHPVPGSLLVATSTYTSYAEGNTVTCVNVVICNKPVALTDALGNVTNISWSSATGLATQILKPADVNGVRPESDFVYTPLTGGTNSCANGASSGGVALLCQKTEKQSSTSSVLTTYGYLEDSYSKYFLSTVTVDPSGLNLRTCFKFDETGNLTSTSDARLTGSCP